MADTVIALEDLYPEGGWAAAHRKGDEFPNDRERIERLGWTDKVAAPSTKAAAKAAEDVKGA